MKRLALTFITLTCTLIVLAQAVSGHSVGSLVRHSDKFNHYLPQERVYLHLDNNGYFMGENIWFKAYVISSDSNRYTHKSRVLYVELINPMGDVVKERKLEIKDGQANGEIDLTQIFMSGFYEIRAYTRYMTNWGENVCFSRLIPVFEKPKAKGDYAQKTIRSVKNKERKTYVGEIDGKDAEAMNVSFYPEGGALVKGLQSKVAFAVNDKDGASFHTQGYLMQGEDTLCKVQTFREGRGTFFYTPSDAPLILTLEDKKGRTKRFPLPKANDNGCVIAVDTESENEIGLKINVCDAWRKRKSKLGIAVTYHGQSELCDSFYTSDGSYYKNFDKKRFKSGINEVSVFDTEGRVHANRMFFIFPKEEHQKHISLQGTNEQISPYGKLSLDFATPEPRTTFSVSVRDYDTEVNGSNTNAATWYLLASDLKGYIHDAKYYLEKDDQEHRRAADLLVLVQGWRNYDFEMMDGYEKIHLTQPAEQSLLLLGQLHPYRKKDVVANVELAVALTNSYKDILSGATYTRNKGYFTFNMPNCYNNWDMVIRTSINDKNKRYYVGINRNFSPIPRSVSYYEKLPLPFTDRPVTFKSVSDSVPKSRDLDVHALREVQIEGKKGCYSTWLNENLGAKKAFLAYFCGTEAEKIIDSGSPLPSFIEWLQAKNPMFQGNDNLSGESPYMKFRYNCKTDGPSYGNSPILWYVDNRFMFATSLSQKYCDNPDSETDRDSGTYATPEYNIGTFPIFIDEVKAVYIMETPENRGPQELHNLKTYSAYIYTYGIKPKPEKGLRYTYFEGFKTPQTFISPDYSVLPPEKDFRRTLYWNPNVTTDGEGKAHIEFYNNSTCQQIIVSAECITKDGVPLVY